MALTEERKLKQVTIKPEAAAAEVQWENTILRDGEVIARTYERKAYQKRTYTDEFGTEIAVDQSAEFLAEVEGAAEYLAALGW